MICQSCAEAADTITSAVRDGEIQPTGHYSEVCDDYGKAIRACACQHRPVQTSESRGESR
jgi:hypothetical protein